MVVVETARGVTTRVLFLPVILTSPGSKIRMPFYLIAENMSTLLRRSDSPRLNLDGARRDGNRRAEDCPPYANRHAFACVGRARHSVRADQGPQTIDYLHRSPITRNFRYDEILGPGQRRGARPCRWPRPGSWRWSRRSRRRAVAVGLAVGVAVAHCYALRGQRGCSPLSHWCSRSLMLSRLETR